MFGDPVLLTKDLGSVCSFYSGGTPSKSNIAHWQGNLPWFSAKDLKSPNLYDSKVHVSESVPIETNIRLLPANTIALVVRGMILAHSVPVSILRTTSTINQDLKALLPIPGIDTCFLAEAVRAQTAWILARVSVAAHGTTKLDTHVLRSIPIPAASLADQQAFAAKVNAIRAQRDRVARALEVDDYLFTALQHRAFRGEL